jgi:hypothetical protein
VMPSPITHARRDCRAVFASTGSVLVRLIAGVDRVREVLREVVLFGGRTSSPLHGHRVIAQPKCL